MANLKTSARHLNDVVMTVPYKHDNIDEACVAAKKAIRLGSTDIRSSVNLLMRLKNCSTETLSNGSVNCARYWNALWDAMTEARNLGNKIDITLNHSIKLVAEKHPHALHWS